MLTAGVVVKWGYAIWGVVCCAIGAWAFFAVGNTFWGWLCVIAGIGHVVRILGPDIRSNFDEQRRQTAMRRMDEEHRRAMDESDQRSKGWQLEAYGEQSRQLFHELPGHLKAADRYLDRAKVDFSERAFTPFWDSMESASAEIGAFADGLDTIAGNVNAYTALVPQFRGEIPRFDVPLRQLPRREDARALTERIDKLMRTAHRDYQFATIYEQRRNTRTMERGLRDLRESIEQMGDSIYQSFSRLNASVDAMHRTVDRGFASVDGKLSDVESAVNSAASAQAQRDRQFARQFDRIRRRL